MIAQLAAVAGLAFFAIAMIYAALQDVATLTIRNRQVLILVAGYVIFAPLAGFGVPAMGQAFGTGSLVLVATFALFAFGLIGGGDAKIAAATAIWLGPEGTLLFLIYTMLIGGGLAIALLFFRTMPLPAMLYGKAWVARAQAPGAGVPYALAMAPAALLVIPSTPWFAYLA